MDLWPVVHSERRALAADLDSVGEAAWDTPSLCTRWTVRDVLAHMTASARLSGPAFLTKMIASGFSLTRLQAKDIAVERGSSPADTLARFKTIVDSTGRPPGPLETMLGETIVHAEDIRTPLGIKRGYPAEALVRVADFYKGSNLIIGGKRRITGVTLEATDTEWRHGTGPKVSGPMLALVQAITGRQSALDDLSGDGVAVLRSRS